MSTSTLAAVVTGPTTTVPARRASHLRVEQAFDGCATGIYRFFVARVGSSALADDLMQHLWLQACKAPESIPAEELQYWLRRVARNILSDHWRRKSRRPTHLSLGAGVAGELVKAIDRGALPDQVLHRREVQQQVMQALTTLTADEQELIRRHYTLGEAFEDIGSDLGVSARAIEGRMYRARKRLRDALAHLDEDA